VVFDAFVFDAYGTLFDLGALTRACEKLWPERGAAVADLWRRKQLEYSWLRTAMERYQPFSELTSAALRFAADSQTLTLDADASLRLLRTYRELEPFPEVPRVLSELAARGRRLAILSNGSPEMLEPLLEHAGLRAHFELVFSVDSVKAFKPARLVYLSAARALSLEPTRIGFVSSNGWDIAGAYAAGLSCLWVNRAKLPPEGLGAEPLRVMNDLEGLLEFTR
jgi:2-haloacid dehalogenase